MSDVEDLAREAGRGLIESASHVELPDVGAVKAARTRRNGVTVAAGAFVATIVVVGTVALTSGGGSPTDVAATPVPAPNTTAPSVVPEPSTSALGGNVFILDDGTGPVVCAGAIAESLPPQCGGLPLAGLDWSTVPWADAAQGQRWADVYVEVELKDGRLTLLSAPEMPHPFDRTTMDFSPPCAAPDGGWTFEAGPGATEADMNAAFDYISSRPEHAGSWVYNLVDPPTEFEFGLVVVASFTGNLAAHEAAISRLWKGPLCVFERDITLGELQAIQAELVSLSPEQLPESILLPTSWSVDVVDGVVEIGAFLVGADAQDWLDERYGAGLVRTSSIMAPIG